jgi:NADH-quinone oxidoreductase subunit B
MYRSYPVVQGIDQFLPVDVYTAGCPPRPENLLNAVMEIQRQVENTKARDYRNIKPELEEPIPSN